MIKSTTKPRLFVVACVLVLSCILIAAVKSTVIVPSAPDFSVADELTQTKPNTVIRVPLNTTFSKRTFVHTTVMNMYSPLFYSVKNVGSQRIQSYIVINNKDWTTGEKIFNHILPNAKNSSPQSQILTLWKYIIRNSTHNKTDFNSGIAEMFNVFGYGWCSDKSIVLSQLARFAGFPVRVIHLADSTISGNVVTEVFYDNAWHLFDTDEKVYFLKKNKEIASIEDIQHDGSILKNYVTYDIYSEDEMFYIKNYQMFFQQPSDTYSYDQNQSDRDFSYSLLPNDEIRFYYDWQYLHLPADYPLDRFTNGILLRKVDVGIDSVSRMIELPYPILKVYFFSEAGCLPVSSLSVILNDSERKVPVGCLQGKSFMMLDSYGYISKVELKKQDLSKVNGVAAIFQVNPQTISRLVSGWNTFSNESSMSGSLLVSFAYASR